MKSYLLAATGVIFLAVLVGLAVPDGKMKKSINFVLRLACILVLVQPVSGLFSGGGGGEKIDINYSYVSATYSSSQSKLLCEKIKKEMEIDCICTVEIAFDGQKLEERGVLVMLDIKDMHAADKLTEYLRGLGYINITVNESGG